MVAISYGAQAQQYKKFKVGLGLGYASASGSGASGGVLLYLEPAYRVTDAIQVGLRIETALVTRGLSQDLEDDASLDIAAIGSYTFNGQYYLKSSGFRPFVGLGFGLYSLAAIKVEGDGEAAAAESKFGVYPRIGFDAGHFQLSLDYNLIPKTKVDGLAYDEVANEFVPEKFEFKNSYIGVRIGVAIGGGKK